jgi:hypothetical protein
MFEQPGPNIMYIAYNSASQTTNLWKREMGKKAVMFSTKHYS